MITSNKTMGPRKKSGPTEAKKKRLNEASSKQNKATFLEFIDIFASIHPKVSVLLLTETSQRCNHMDLMGV